MSSIAPELDRRIKKSGRVKKEGGEPSSGIPPAQDITVNHLDRIFKRIARSSVFPEAISDEADAETTVSRDTTYYKTLSYVESRQQAGAGIENGLNLSSDCRVKIRSPFLSLDKRGVASDHRYD
jgi:hypothetical protein